MHGVGVGGGMHHDRLDAEFLGGAQNAQRDLATVGDEDLLEHRRGGFPSYSITTSGLPYSTGCASSTRIAVTVPDAGRGDLVHGLHGLDDEQRLALAHRLADLDEGLGIGRGRQIGGADHRRGDGIARLVGGGCACRPRRSASRQDSGRGGAARARPHRPAPSASGARRAPCRSPSSTSISVRFVSLRIPARSRISCWSTPVFLIDIGKALSLFGSVTDARPAPAGPVCSRAARSRRSCRSRPVRPSRLMAKRFAGVDVREMHLHDRQRRRRRGSRRGWRSRCGV